MVFLIASGIYLVGLAAYWFWSSGELQSWAKKSEKEVDTKPNIIDKFTYVGYMNEGAEIELK